MTMGEEGGSGRVLLIMLVLAVVGGVGWFLLGRGNYEPPGPSNWDLEVKACGEGMIDERYQVQGDRVMCTDGKVGWIAKWR